MTEKELYKKALDTWGIYAQTLVFHEEMAEVFNILLTTRDYENTNIIEELADAIIMTEQMMISFDIDRKECLKQMAFIYKANVLHSYISGLNEVYSNTNILMSHFCRNRCSLEHLAESLNRLLELLLLIGAHLCSSDDLQAAKNLKLTRLAGMLGETYEAGE